LHTFSNKNEENKLNFLLSISIQNASENRWLILEKIQWEGINIMLEKLTVHMKINWKRGKVTQVYALRC
jgi:hypothetical protein